MLAKRHQCISLLAAGALAVSVTSPARAQFKPDAIFGAIAGGVIGGAIGGGIGRGGSGRGIVGAIVGVAIGAAIAQHLSEQNRGRMRSATQNAFESGRPQKFKSKEGEGRVIVNSTSKNEKGESCRTVTQEFEKSDGTVVKDTVSGCKGPNGWKV